MAGGEAILVIGAVALVAGTVLLRTWVQDARAERAARSGALREIVRAPVT